MLVERLLGDGRARVGSPHVAGHGRGARRPDRRAPSGDRRWVVLALLLQAALAAIDIVAPDEVIFTTHVRAGAVRARGVGARPRDRGARRDRGRPGDRQRLLERLRGHRPTTCCGSRSSPPAAILATLAAAAIERSRRATRADGAARRRRPPVGRRAHRGRDRRASRTRSSRPSRTPAGSTSTSPTASSAACSSTARDAPPPGSRGSRRPPTRALIPLTRDVGVLGLKTAERPLRRRRPRVPRDPRRPRRARARQRPPASPTCAPRAPAWTASSARLAEAVTVNDDRGQTIYANQAAATLLGRAPREEVTGARPGELAARFSITHEDGAPVAVDDLPGRRLVAGEPAPELLTRSVDKDTGQGFWLLTKATLAARPGPRLRGQHHRGRHGGQGRRAAPALPRRGGPAAGLEPRLRADAPARRRRSRSPWLADWCAVDLPTADGGIEQVALAHDDPAKVAHGRGAAPPLPARSDDRERRPRRPPRRAAGALPRDPGRAARAGDQRPRAARGDPRDRHAQRDDRPDARSATTTLGALTLVTADSGRRFSDDRLRLRPGPRAARRDRDPERPPVRGAGARRAHAAVQPAARAPAARCPAGSAAASYQAGEQGADVGGDFYDIVPTGGGRHLVFLGDVTGKGIAAAALTAPRPPLGAHRRALRPPPRGDPRARQRDPRRAAAAGAGHARLRADRRRARSRSPPPATRRRCSSAAATSSELGAAGILLGAVARPHLRSSRPIDAASRATRSCSTPTA